MRKVFDFFFPKVCVGCQKNGEFLCEQCLEKIPVEIHSKELTKDFFVSSFFSYDDEIFRKSVIKGKYLYAPEIFSRLCNPVLSSICVENFPKNSVFIPVPLHFWRQKKRGYNQSQIIAEKFANHFSEFFTPPIIDLVHRVKNTPQQARLAHPVREKNIKDAFTINTKIFIEKHTPLILVDDVVTSGSTLKEIFFLLKKNKFTHIQAITLGKA